MVFTPPSSPARGARLGPAGPFYLCVSRIPSSPQATQVHTVWHRQAHTRTTHTLHTHTHMHTHTHTLSLSLFHTFFVLLRQKMKITGKFPFLLALWEPGVECPEISR